MEPGTYTAVDNKELAMLKAAQKFCEKFWDDREADLDEAEELTMLAFQRWRDLWDKPPATEPSPDLVVPSPANGWLGGLCPSLYDSDIHGDEVLCYSENIHGSSMHPTPKTGYHWHLGNPAASERTRFFWPLPAGFPVSDSQDDWVGNPPVDEGPDEEIKAKVLACYEEITRMVREKRLPL